MNSTSFKVFTTSSLEISKNKPHQSTRLIDGWRAGNIENILEMERRFVNPLTPVFWQ